MIYKMFNLFIINEGKIYLYDDNYGHSFDTEIDACNKIPNKKGNYLVMPVYIQDYDREDELNKMRDRHESFIGKRSYSNSKIQDATKNKDNTATKRPTGLSVKSIYRKKRVNIK